MKLAILIFSLLMAGCAVQGPPFERVIAPPGNATIYVYRPYKYASSLLRPAVTCGDDTSRIGPGGYHAFTVSSNRPTLCHVAAETTDEVEIDAQPRVYYIREEFGWGVLSGHPHLNPIDNDKAQAEIAGCCVQQQSVDSEPPPPP